MAGNKNGLGNSYSGAIIDSGSNKGASGPSKRIGTIQGRLKQYKGGHSAATNLQPSTGMSNKFGNGYPVEETGGITRGNKPAG